jgi:hypothetical protein
MDKHALGTAIAGGAIAVALLETLHDKGVLTLEEARAVLERALGIAGTYAQANGGFEALNIITEQMRGKFTARR